MTDPKKMYQKREAGYTRLLRKQDKAGKRLSNLRLLVFALGIGAAVLMYTLKNYLLLAAVLILFAVFFVYLVTAHEKLKDRRRITALLRDVNNSSLKRVKGEWSTFPDQGEDFRDDGHSYTSDLDIFGKNSLFQWINTAKTFLGRDKLRQLLSGVTGRHTDILERQHAVKELAARLKWRQRFLAEALMSRGKMHNPGDIISWAKERNEVFTKPWLIVFVRIFPVFTVILIVAGFILDLIPRALPLAALAGQYSLLFYKGKELNRMLSISERYAGELRVYFKMLRHFEEQKFKSELLVKIQKGLKNQEGAAAYKQVARLSALVDSISNRRNMVYFILNIITLWDFHNIIVLERWKRQSGNLLESWLKGLGKVEALASLAVIRFDNPHWALPVLSEGDDTFLEAEDIGHPLLLGKRVLNDLAINNVTKVVLITGSNMSGKSTLLRTAGINLVLAYAGAPVCARVFSASIMEICSCMRVSDNLGENVSSFYAELLRVKEIVHRAEAGKKVFFLLDEVFKGTNSLDRHTGARVLINKLSSTRAIGLVSTHDLELCGLEGENDKIANYHFQEYYKAGKIYFDYRLRQGPSTTRNALYLMRLAGIDISSGEVE